MVTVRRLAPVIFSCVVISGCTTTVSHRSSLASTRTSARATAPQITVTPAPRSLSTNYLAPLRHTNQIYSENTKTSTFEKHPAIAHYSGTPRLAGTVVRNSARSGSHEAQFRKPVTVGEPPGPQTAPAQGGQIPNQPGSISLTSGAQDTQGGSNEFASPNAFSLLGIFGILVVLALGIWGMVWFLGYWKTLNPSSWSAGEGTYSDDSQESSPEVFSKSHRDDASCSRPKEDIKAISRN